MTSERERMLNGDRYDPYDPELVAERERARELTRRYNDTAATDDRERRELLEELLGSLGEECHVEPPFRCDYGYNVHVGEDFYANFDCVVLDACRVEIGRNCRSGRVSTSTRRPIRSMQVSGPTGRSTANRLRSGTTFGSAGER